MKAADTIFFAYFETGTTVTSGDLDLPNISKS